MSDASRGIFVFFENETMFFRSILRDMMEQIIKNIYFYFSCNTIKYNVIIMELESPVFKDLQKLFEDVAIRLLIFSILS